MEVARNSGSSASPRADNEDQLRSVCSIKFEDASARDRDGVRIPRRHVVLQRRQPRIGQQLTGAGCKQRELDVSDVRAESRHDNVCCVEPHLRCRRALLPSDRLQSGA